MPGSGRRSPTAVGAASGKVKRSSSTPSLNSRPKEEASPAPDFSDERSRSGSYSTTSTFSGCSTPIAGLIWKGPMKSKKTAISQESGQGFYQPNYIGASCDEYKPRCKKRGYDHPAAHSDIAIHLTMPSQLLPVQSCRTIDSYQEQKVAAGLTTAKLTQITRCDNVHTTKDNAARRRQQGVTDPITHRVRDDGALTEFEMDGAAGLPSYRKGKAEADDPLVGLGKSHKGNPILGKDESSKQPTGKAQAGKAHAFRTAQQSAEMQRIMYNI